MNKWLRKLMITGTGICLSAFVLSGCEGEAKNDSAPEVSNEKNSSKEAVQLNPAEHPSFLPDGIRRVVLNQEGKEIFHLANEPAEYKMDFDYWEIINPYDETMTVNTEEMYHLFEALCDFDFQTPAEVGDGVETGIQDSSTSFVLDFVDTQDGEKAKQAEYADSTAEIIIGSEDGEGNRFAAVKGKEEAVYKLSESVLDAIYSLNPFDYILKIPVLVDIETVGSIDITIEDQTYTMEINAAEEKYKFGKKKADKEEFTALYQALSSVILDSETEGEKSEEAAELSVTYHRNMEEAPEITVEYIPYDEDRYSVKINQKERFFVNGEDVEELKEQVKKAFN